MNFISIKSLLIKHILLSLPSANKKGESSSQNGSFSTVNLLKNSFKRLQKKLAHNVKTYTFAIRIKNGKQFIEILTKHFIINGLNFKF